MESDPTIDAPRHPANTNSLLAGRVLDRRKRGYWAHPDEENPSLTQTTASAWHVSLSGVRRGPIHTNGYEAAQRPRPTSRTHLDRGGRRHFGARGGSSGPAGEQSQSAEDEQAEQQQNRAHGDPPGHSEQRARLPGLLGLRKTDACRHRVLDGAAGQGDLDLPRPVR